MLRYKRIVSDLLEENIYILSDENKDSIIIDPGLGFHHIKDYIEENNLKPIAILATHAHIDHIASAEECQRKYSIPIYMCKEDSLLIENYEKLAGFWKVEARKPKITNWIDKNETEIKINNFEFRCFFNPGHSPGCMSFEIDNTIFCGDLIFKGSIGRTDLPASSPLDMEKSLESFVNSFDIDSILCTGHGDETSLGQELKTNPFLMKYAR